MWAAGLVAGRQVERALLVKSYGADCVADVVQNVILSDPTARLGEAAADKVDAIGGAERQLGTVRVDEVSALGGIHLLVVHGDSTARDRISGGRLARLQVDPGIVAYVMRALALIDSQEVDGATAIAQLDADVVAVNGTWPVGDAVGVNLATKHANRGRVLVVGGGRDSPSGGAGYESEDRDGKECARAVHVCVPAVSEGVGAAM